MLFINKVIFSSFLIDFKVQPKMEMDFRFRFIFFLGLKDLITYRKLTKLL